MAKVWVTSETNPFDYFTQTDRWIDWDFQMGEGICCALARRFQGNPLTMSPAEYEDRIDEAVQELLYREYGTGLDGKTIIHYVPLIQGEASAW